MDRVLIGLAAIHATVLLLFPTAPVVAIGLWWNANTISHNFIHRPFFRRRAANRLFAAGLSVLMGIPHALWRDRHLAHHAGRPWRLKISRELVQQTLLVLGLWTAIAWIDSGFFAFAYAPAYAAGLLMCAIHGHYEHAAGTTSHYGRVYNLLFLNDGYHVEHHRHPFVSWRELPAHRAADAPVSRWPAPLRWIEGDGDQNSRGSAPDPGSVACGDPCAPRRSLAGRSNDSADVAASARMSGAPCAPSVLVALERMVLRSRALRRLVLRVHERAIRSVTAALPPPHRIAIVGGGLFPRTALIARTIWPGARITLIDASRAHLDRAKAEIGEDDRLEFSCGRYPEDVDADACDLLVIPLSLAGDRLAVYAHPPAPAVLVHDWIWRRRGTSRIVSTLLLKRINLVRG